MGDKIHAAAATHMKIGKSQVDGAPITGWWNGGRTREDKCEKPGGSHKRLAVLKKGKSVRDTQAWGTEHKDDNRKGRFSLSVNTLLRHKGHLGKSHWCSCTTNEANIWPIVKNIFWICEVLFLTLPRSRCLSVNLLLLRASWQSEQFCGISEWWQLENLWWATEF